MEFENGWGLAPPEEPVDSSTDDVAPVLPDEVIEDVTTGAWQRRLVLPNQDGELRVLPVSRVRRRSA